MTLAYELHTAPGRIRLTLHGEVDLSTRDELVTSLGHTRSRAVTEVDLRNVTFLDCSAIGALVAARNTAHREGRAVIVSHPHGIVRFLLELTDVLPSLTALPRRMTHRVPPAPPAARCRTPGPPTARSKDTPGPVYRHASGR